MDPFISIKELTLSKKGKDILKDINLDIYKGKTLAILGPNGAGKSTLLELILNDFKPSQGAVSYQFKAKQFFRNKIGVVYNNESVFPQLYVKELLAFYQKLYRSDGVYLQELLKLFDLEKLQNTLVRELSEGEKKKLAILTALFHKPELVVLDEPFSNVDVTMIDGIWGEIKKLGATVIIATHDWDFAEKNADEILFLEGGKMLYEKFSTNEKDIILPAKKKLVTQRDVRLLETLPKSEYYEKDQQLNILMTPNLNLQSVKKVTFNYSIIDVTVKDIFYYLSLSKK